MKYHHDSRIHTSLKGEAMADRIGAFKYAECSAKTREGIADLFQVAARAALLRKPKSRGRGGRSGCAVL